MACIATSQTVGYADSVHAIMYLPTEFRRSISRMNDDSCAMMATRSDAQAASTIRTVLILGGYGFFGRRIATALAHETGIRLLIGGRNVARARNTASALGLPSSQGVGIDAQCANLSRELAGLRVDLLIHTAGPFQQQDYRVARAAIAAGCHYIDLADGRQFVAGIHALDALAKSREVSIVSGASSVPALSSAVVDRYVSRFARLDSIDIGISSGARSPGLATVRGIFGYAGKPFQCWRDSRWTTSYGWLALARHRFPAPLGPRFLGTCDVPDLELFPKQYPSVHTVSFRAGFASGIGHLVVWALACGVRAGILRSLAPFARPLHRISLWIEPLVSDQGGMFVQMRGLGVDQQRLDVNWHLLARNNHGPQIPCGAAIALSRKLIRGAKLPVGAMPCTGLLTVEEYLDPLRGLDIQECVA